jgi:glycosyltransferase involved in cell wall biosynthesis
LDILQSKGVHCEPVEMHRSVGLHDRHAIKSLRHLLRADQQAELIHAHSSKAGALVRLARPSVPVIYSPHALYTFGPGGSKKKMIFAMIERRLARKTAAIIVNTKEEFEHALSIGLPERKLHIVHHGIHPAAARPRDEIRKELGIPSDAAVVGFVGRFDYPKEPLAAIEAFKLADDGSAYLVMCGFGPQEAEVRAAIADLGSRAKVVIDGNGPELMHAFDILIVPSLHESFGYMFLEAAAAGTAVAAYPVGVGPDFSDGGNAALIARLADVQDLAKHVRTLLAEPETRQRIAEAARERLHQFSVPEMARATAEIYQQALRGDA